MSSLQEFSMIQVILGIQDSQVHYLNAFILGFKALSFPVKFNFSMKNFLVLQIEYLFCCRFTVQR